MKKDYIGFGFSPKEGENHFYVVIPADEKESVSVTTVSEYLENRI